uniref:Uncharacterized protein n=1 Tax=Bicosoecida sp. CB-2014 TaxID=1486930 RepID=A0A7S1GDP0_9STRA|mmetsp:Transcript_5689/g.20416  ORF Transcript_5689/g.20416 Transcript_5689/m.20416 type:complete len:144 (+) Transcript_5689:427-858(+)
MHLLRVRVVRGKAQGRLQFARSSVAEGAGVAAARRAPRRRRWEGRFPQGAARPRCVDAYGRYHAAHTLPIAEGGAVCAERPRLLASDSTSDESADDARSPASAMTPHREAHAHRAVAWSRTPRVQAWYALSIQAVRVVWRWGE